MSHACNRLLSLLPDLERRAVEPILTVRRLAQNDQLAESGAVIERIYFPHDAVISLVVPLSSGDTVETAMTGHDGVVGAGGVLNEGLSTTRAMVQLAGTCQCCKTTALAGILDDCPTLRRLLVRHEEALFAQVQQTAACNATHNIESRLARWLLRARDLAGNDAFHLTQESMAEMMSVRRTSVTLIAHKFQQSGLINYKRGHLQIVNPAALAETACECYEAVKLNYDALGQSETARRPGGAHSSIGHASLTLGLIDTL